MESEDLIKIPLSSNSSGESVDVGVCISGCELTRASDSLHEKSEVRKDGEILTINGNSSCCLKCDDDQPILARELNEDMDISPPTLPFSVESTETVPVTGKVSLLSSEHAENGFCTSGKASSGTKRPRMTVDNQQPSVRVIYNSLTRASRKKLQELLQQWSEWSCPSSNDSIEELESGEEIYFPALNLGVEKASAVPFWIDDKTKNPTNKDFVPLDGNSVPLYDRGFSLALTSVDGPNNLESNLKVLNSSRCFNCGSYTHSLRECPKPRDRVAVDKAKKEHMSKRSHNASSRNQTRYYQSSPQGKFDGLRPGLLDSETRQLLKLGELDPPPWLNRMRELGYPPGYLDSQDGDQPSGITIFADEECKKETKGNILEIGSHDQSRKKSPKAPKKMSVEYPGINAPLPDNADRMHWKALTPTSDGYYRKCDSSLDSFSNGYDLGTYNARSDYQDDRLPGSHDLWSLQRYGLSSDSFSDGHGFGTYNRASDYQDDRGTGSYLRSCSQRYGISDHLYNPIDDSSTRAIPDHLSYSRYNISADSINRDYSHVPDIPPGSYLRSTSDRYDSYDHRYTSHDPLGFPSGLRRSSYGRSL